MPHVQTVLGPVPPDELGRVMPHEHLLSLTPGPQLGARAPLGDPVDLAVHALAGLRERGFGTIVDLSPYNVVGRDAEGLNVELLAEISRRSRMHVVSGTALYLEPWAPAWAKEASLTQLTDRLVEDIESGINGSGVRAGVLGEQATGLGSMSAFEERALRASARAAVRTGCALMTHTTHGTLALDQVELLVAEGVDPARIVVGHIDTQLDPQLPRRVLAAGACVAVDTIGKQEWEYYLTPPQTGRDDGEFGKRCFHRSDEGRADLVAGLVADGFGDRVLLAQDLTGAEAWMNNDTHGESGYLYLADVFAPMLAARGITGEQYEQLVRHTPARLLAVAS